MNVDRLDHLVLTVRDVAASVAFYTALGMEHTTFGAGRTALTFGSSKINLHDAAHPIHPHAAHPTPGSADLCLIVDGPLDDVVAHLGRLGVPVQEGPVDRTGATGLRSRETRRLPRRLPVRREGRISRLRSAASTSATRTGTSSSAACTPAGGCSSSRSRGAGTASRRVDGPA